ncbi:UDP-glucose flavonoid 3-O-glucosyltransferase 7-like [Argentina anserina]|uniref:UDP-glucose flavonoid 3-O-glucosyltransferase 7-like n=1 Tax=Argentina anserina TaxID=57926 RepID=UPI00217631B8|nr:UDP-glucose flavonoid 3-O-glucosyltransferase 7-like [Potentilla anserina]
METKTHEQLHIFFLPFMGQGHTLPLIDIAKLFASRGEKSTIITTPANAPIFTRAIQTSRSSGLDIELLLIKFPSTEVGLPEGIESSNWSETAEIAEKFFKALSLLEQQIEKLLHQYHPHCIVSSSLFHWTTDLAAKFGIPRLIFQGPGFFPLCASMSVTLYQPHMKVASDSEAFVLPNLPHEIIITRNELPSYIKQDDETEILKLLKQCRETEKRSFGIIINSFYELEPDYADHYRKAFGRKSWHIGPVSLCNTAENDQSARGREGSDDQVHECLHWLNSKKPNSVVYVCFGSLNSFSDCVLTEIALGLEASEHQFIWVAKKEKDDKEEWLPEGFEQRMEGKGLIIRGWAPQLLILQHEAVGAFLTHCGWNSILEGVTAGVPMITWPLFADQFYNEKLVTQILGIGVSVGSRKTSDGAVKSKAGVKWEAIKKAVTEIMDGDEAEKIRCKAVALGEIARSAVEEGGSSYSDLTALIEEVRSFKS